MRWLERQRNFLEFTLSSLLRRKWKNASLALVYALIVFLLSSVVFLANALRKEALSLLKDAPEMIVQRMVAGRHDLIPLGYADGIGEIRGVRSVHGRLWGYYYHPANRANYTIMVPEEFSYGDQDIVVGNGVLRSWETRRDPGLYFRTFNGETMVMNVKESFDASSELVTSDLVLMSENAFRRLFGMGEGLFTDLAVIIRNPAEYEVIAEKIVTLFPDTRPILRDEIERTYASLFDWRSGYAVILLIGAGMAFFIFAWDKATGLSDEEKKEIGILKALGWDTGDVLAVKFWEGVVISLTAFFIGVIVAYMHVFLLSAPLFSHAFKGWSVLYPEFTLAPSIDAYQLAILFCLTVLPYTVITVIPTWRVSVTEPDSVMKQI
ncbi:MAG: ABC transporter permease [Deltaproteobacteria bacterium]|nr:ABC transporter permease [Deltaproteobacteria bacterium]